MDAPYINLAMAQLPRLLSRMDREALSSTYGACDRTYWSWKFTDFPGARFQEALYALAWIYTRPLAGNRLYGHPLVREWIIAGFHYWQTLQHADGSFDEAYPYERSLAATAFTGFYLGEAYLLLDNALPVELRESLRTTFRRVGDWLCSNDEYHGVLSNHLAAAAAALTVITKIDGESRHVERAGHFVRRILARQSAEGWYEEYGGADFGYQTHGSFYLARVWQLTGDMELLDSLKRSVAFLTYFVHPNGTLGGEYGSRNTSFYFPAAFEMLSSACPEAAAIASFMRTSVARQDAAGLAAVVAYNFCPLLNNYLFAHDAMGPLDEVAPLPFEEVGQWTFPKAGLLVHATNHYQAVFAPSKGGVLKIYDKHEGRLAYSDCGYWGEAADGALVSSQSFSLDNDIQLTPGRGMVRAPFALVNQKLMNSTLFIGFRLFTLTIGRFTKMARLLKTVLVKVLVSRRKTLGVFLLREVEFLSDGVMIRDQVDIDPRRPLRHLTLGGKFSSIHMGSSRYFQFDELDPLSIDGKATLRREFFWQASGRDV
ncbi:MAG: hypothetical protein K9J74_00555 [Sulfuritalea sp.]|nr:hypothetical protein [Sulfuritalea sp.]